MWNKLFIAIDYKTIQAQSFNFENISKPFPRALNKNVSPKIVIIVLDVSSKVGETYFQCMLEVLNEALIIINQQNLISSMGTKIGIVRFSGKATILLPFEIGINLTSVTNFIKTISFTGGDNRLDRGLDLANKMLTRGGRYGIDRIVLLLSDGISTEDPIPLADTMKSTSLQL
ncbi:unnamed protein product [Gordionus sp. m RMFG-2023]